MQSKPLPLESWLPVDSLSANEIRSAEKWANKLRIEQRWERASEVYQALRGAYPGLRFRWWAEEAEMWEDVDQQRLQDALIEAKASWQDLPREVRLRDDFKELGRDVFTLEARYLLSSTLD